MNIFLGEKSLYYSDANVLVISEQEMRITAVIFHMYMCFNRNWPVYASLFHVLLSRWT